VRDVYATSPIFSMVQSYNYDPYGNATLAPATPPLTHFRYAGMLYHADSGLYLTHYRAYDPRTGRWLSRDPIGQTRDVNLYAYVEANPIGRIDQNGEDASSLQPGPVGPEPGSPNPTPTLLSAGKAVAQNPWGFISGCLLANPNNTLVSQIQSGQIGPEEIARRASEGPTVVNVQNPQPWWTTLWILCIFGDQSACEARQ
jgi:RHS repeat-associated protein